MGPIVFNGVSSKMVQIDMRGSVGRGGVNHPRDVRLVQALLNAVPGTTAAPLVTDGLVGPKTLAAITDFQRRTLGFSDGRIDVGGPTIQGVVEAVQRSAKPFPNVDGISSPSPQTVNALQALTFPTPTSFKPSNWKLDANRGVSIGLLVVGTTTGQIRLQEDAPSFRRITLNFHAVGIGLSRGPPLSGQQSSFQSANTDARVFIETLTFPRPTLEPDDFAGGLSILEISAAGGPAVSVTEFMFGLHPRKAFMTVAGFSIGTPALGATLFVGAVHSISKGGPFFTPR